VLQINGISKAYGDRELFSNVTFTLAPRERIGLVGRNGSGKSTLFRMLLGSEAPDTGSIICPKHYSVGHLAQHLVFTEPTILAEACLGLKPDERDQEYRAEIILTGLGFSLADFQRPPSAFSGGFQIRINLAKLLLSEPNLLLLDEPTNYLDIVSMRWLSTFLREWTGEMILISHDRTFMDSVTTHTMIIHRGQLRKMQGGTKKLYEQIKVDEEIYQKTKVNEDKKRQELEVFISRFRAQASKAALVQSKVKALERMGVKEELAREAELDFRFSTAAFEGKTLLEAKDISFGYSQETQLISELRLSIGRRDRIGIIGKNGKGKSTLLRLIAGELQPTTGAVATNQHTRIGYFGQTNISRLHPEMTVEEEVSQSNLALHRTNIRAICGTMMFEGDDALKKVKVLSGGEKSRVLLGKILAQPTNLLLLDEPTNHLDMESIEALIDSLKSYEGAVVIVTHSELILSELATRLVVFQEGYPRLFEHEYAYFLEQGGWGDGGEGEPSSHTAKNITSKADADKGERRLRGEFIQERSRVLKPLEQKVGQIEGRIEKNEQELKRVELDLASASSKGDAPNIGSLSLRFKQLQRSIEKDFDELTIVSTELEKKRNEFEE
jgi:ATP-binding cassette subfamily F protein 3